MYVVGRLLFLIIWVTFACSFSWLLCGVTNGISKVEFIILQFLKEIRCICNKEQLKKKKYNTVQKFINGIQCFWKKCIMPRLPTNAAFNWYKSIKQQYCKIFLECKITVFYFNIVLKFNSFLWCKAEFSPSLLQSSVSNDHQKSF